MNRTAAPLGASFTGKADGVWYFHVRAVDGTGNGGDPTTRAVRIDTTPPVTTDDAPVSFGTSPITVALTPTDGASGMSGGSAGTWYKLDNAASFTAGTSVNVSGAGTHTLRYYSEDAAGNSEATKTVTITGGVVPTYTLTPTSGAHGSISPPTQQTVNEGDSPTFTIKPDGGYHVADVWWTDLGGRGRRLHVQQRAGAHTITRHLRDHTFTITIAASAGANGSISPSGACGRRRRRARPSPSRPTPATTSPTCWWTGPRSARSPATPSAA